MAAFSSFRGRCLSENTILALARGDEVPHDAVAHLDDCDDCQVLVGCVAGDRSRSREEISATRPADVARLRAALLTRGTQVRRYRVVRTIGAGAMGIVYEAHDPELDRRVALKLLQTQDDVGSARLYREAQALARVSHPNVIPVFDVGTYGEQVFMAMEFVDGASLSDWLAERPRPWRDVLRTFIDAGRGLAVAHAAGLVHRDFKPDNVLVGKDGRVRVVDFGLAASASSSAAPSTPALPSSTAHESTDDEGRMARSLTRTGTVMGTPAYMAPEQYRGERADARSDQFAFCVALFEALYGERPFEATSIDELARAVNAGYVRGPKETRGVPRHIHRAVVRGSA